MIRSLTALMDPFPHRHVRLASSAGLTNGVMSLVLAFIYGWIRADMGGPGFASIIAACLITLTMIAAWIVLVVLVREGLIASLAIAALLTFAALALLPAVALLPFGSLFLGLLASVVIGLAAAPMFQSLRQLGTWRIAVLVALGLAAAGSLFLAQNAYTYSHVLGPEMALTGQQHADPLFHAAHAEMLLHYGRMSTGLDGLVNTPYHVLSHLWIGATGRLIGVTTLEAYMLVPAIVGLPMFFFALCIAVIHALPGGEERRVEWIAIPAAFSTIFLVEIWDYGAYVASESYLLAMIGALLGMAALADMVRTRSSADEPRSALRRDFALVLLTLLLMASKLSVGAVFACGAFWVVFRWRSARLLHACGWGVLLALLALLFMWLTSSSAHTGFMTIDPMHILRAYPEIARINFSVCGLGLIVALALWFPAGRPDRIRLEALGVIIIAAFVPTASFRIGGGSGYYFIHVATVAVVVLSARLLTGLFWNNVRVGALAAIVMIAGVPVTHAATDRKRNAQVTIAARAEQMIQNFADASAPLPARAAPVSWWRQPIAPLRTFDVNQAKLTSLGQRLLVARALVPDALLSSTLLHVTSDAERFWKGPRICRNAPLLGPSITGMPMLKGLPPAEMACDFAGLYGYADYSTRNSHAVAANDADLCRLAQNVGFKAVLIIDRNILGRFVQCELTQQ